MSHRGDDDRPTIDLLPQHRGDERGNRTREATTELDSGAHDLGDLHRATEPMGIGLYGAIDDPDDAAASDRPLTERSATKSAGATSVVTRTTAGELRREEMDRTRTFVTIGVYSSLGAFVAAAVVHGDPFGFRLILAGISMTLIGIAWIAWTTREPATFTQRRLLIGATLLALGAQAGIYYWGVASPVTATVVYGLYFFSLGDNLASRLSQYLLCAACHAALSLAIMFEVVEDRAVIRVGHLPVIDQVVALLVVQFIYLMAFVMARRSRQSTIEALARTEQAVRAVAQREALLAEARQELERALRVGGPGRYSEQIVGSFRLGVLIGRGGMGEVYEARRIVHKLEPSDSREGREAESRDVEAAVKLLAPGVLSDGRQVQRFLREAEAAAKVESPSVVKVLEVGTTAGEIPYIAMERLRGFDLAHHLRAQRKLLPVATLTLVEEVADGLIAACRAGVVHRDLKPHNLFWAERDGNRRWKILDFGVSKLGGSGTLTRGTVVGTPAYMAPEQARGESVDHRADLYSLAAILYRALTGHPAFTGKDVPSTLYDVVYRMPSRPSLLAELPSDVDRVLAVGLAKDAASRFADATELVAWLRAALGEGLSSEQRRRADALITAFPWGSRTTQTSSSSSSSSLVSKR